MYRLFLCALLAHTLIADDIDTPAHTMQHHEQILQAHSPTPSEQMINLMHEPMIESAFVDGDNLDLNFLSNMIPHHQGAIEASEFLLKHSKNQKVRALAQKIIETQKAEITLYEELLPKLKEQKKLYSPKEVTLFNNQAKVNMESAEKAMSEITLTQHLNHDFLLSMIPHHQGAIEASKQILQYTQNEEIKSIAEHIINTQEEEIKAIELLLKSI
ncbi:DUF305 domain-containing protein [Helicobacter marmotae]|uniref:DUF305 domain-containing protein n=1 Tax=Helicobacter marmotae TaxID=152490 RepID=A0A3D8I3G7_9HELI|nr:DUF305 domain-containing protein [Helicobacter marmotae]RDU59274.1 DUF305 domain-containing protein [Helicobacter marmotae]